jgi:hypothetical protein
MNIAATVKVVVGIRRTVQALWLKSYLLKAVAISKLNSTTIHLGWLKKTF